MRKVTRGSTAWRSPHRQRVDRLVHGKPRGRVKCCSYRIIGLQVRALPGTCLIINDLRTKTLAAEITGFTFGCIGTSKLSVTQRWRIQPALISRPSRVLSDSRCGLRQHGRIQNRVDERAERRCHLALLGIAQEQARERRGPTLEQRHQPARGDVVGHCFLDQETRSRRLQASRACPFPSPDQRFNRNDKNNQMSQVGPYFSPAA
jgi:hypothetical protein